MPAPEEPVAPAPPPREPPPKSFIPRVLPGSDPAEGSELGGKVPTGGIVGPLPVVPFVVDPFVVGPTPRPGVPNEEPVPEEVPAPEPVSGAATASAPEEPDGGEPDCPTRGALAPVEAALAPEAAAPEGELAGRAAAGVPPLKSDEGAAPVEGAAAARAEGEPVVPAELVPFEPLDPTAGAAATRGVPKLLGAEAPAPGALAVEPLLPKLGGLEGEDAAEPEPTGGIVGRVEPPAGSKSDPPPKEDDGGGLFEG